MRVTGHLVAISILSCCTFLSVFVKSSFVPSSGCPDCTCYSNLGRRGRWAWIIYAGVLLCCICPMLFFFFKWRRDKEAEMEGYGGSG